MMNEFFDFDELDALQPEIARPTQVNKHRTSKVVPANAGKSGIKFCQSFNGDETETSGRQIVELQASVPAKPRNRSPNSDFDSSCDTLAAARASVPVVPNLSLQQALKYQEDIIAEYRKPEFQEHLHRAWKQAGSDPLKQSKARQEACLPFQIPILKKHGFEPSLKGVIHSLNAFADYVSSEPIIANHMTIQILINPELQRTHSESIKMLERFRSKNSTIWLNRIESVSSVFYEDKKRSVHTRVPCCAMAATASADTLELAEYILADPDGPWAELTGVVDSPKFTNCLQTWRFKGDTSCSADKHRAPATGSMLFKAHWHALPDVERHDEASSKVSTALRRAPLRTMAFLQAFREANALCWEKLVLALRQITPPASGREAFRRMVTVLCDSIEQDRHFGFVETCVCCSTCCMYSLPEDQPASLLHLSLTLHGECSLRLESKDKKVAADLDLDMPAGSIHLFSPFWSEHRFTHEADVLDDPVVTLHCSFQLQDASDFGHSLEQVARSVCKSIREAGIHRMLRLPSMLEIVKQEITLKTQENEIAGGISYMTRWANSVSRPDIIKEDVFFIGTWEAGDMTFEISNLNGEMRIATIATPGTPALRGKLVVGDHKSLRTAVLSDGRICKLRPDFNREGCISIFMGTEDPMHAFKQKPHLVTSWSSYRGKVLQTVRDEALKYWSVDDACPSITTAGAKEGSRSHPLRYLAACNCGPADKRSRFLNLLMIHCQKHLPKTSALVYASFGSGELWFDWWVLEALRFKGFTFSGAHFIDLIYQSETVREARFQKSALGNMAAWLQAEGVPSYAYSDINDFRKSVPQGADVMVQCDADFAGINVSDYLSPNGLHCWLQGEGGSSGVWKLKDDDLLQLCFDEY